MYKKCYILNTNHKNKKMKRTAKGFSMIELLIVIAIIVIMTGVLLSQKTNKSAIEVQSATRTVAAQLRSLQNDALNGKIADGKIICKAEMSFDPVNEQYSIKYYNDCSSSVVLETNTFNLVKSDLQTGGTISFLVPMGKVNINLDGGVKRVLLVSASDPSQKMTVCVNDAGNIEEIKGDVATCNS